MWVFTIHGYHELPIFRACCFKISTITTIRWCSEGTKLAFNLLRHQINWKFSSHVNWILIWIWSVAKLFWSIYPEMSLMSLKNEVFEEWRYLVLQMSYFKPISDADDRQGKSKWSKHLFFNFWALTPTLFQSYNLHGISSFTFNTGFHGEINFYRFPVSFTIRQCMSSVIQSYRRNNAGAVET